MAIAQGTSLGRYKIRSMLGAGGMGEVYLADDPNLHRPVAVKVLHADITINKDRLRRFEREAFAASSLNHPNILTIHEIGSHNQYHFIVTEFVDGESLGEHLRREPFQIGEVLEIGIQIASALTAAHAAGIVHRDIKPDNVMIRRDRFVKILDFGLAKLGEAEIFSSETQSKGLPLTMPGIVMGTARYMSPEQARGLPLDARTDIWSLGVVLYEMLTAHAPFTGTTTSDVIVSVLTKDPPLLTSYRPDVPTELEHIIAKALRKDEEERYQAVKGLELDLKSLKQRLEFEAEFERSGEPRSSDEGSRKVPGTQDPQLAKTLLMSERKRTGYETTQVMVTPTNSDASLIHTSSSAEYIVAEIKRHKRTVVLILAMFFAVTALVAYFAYARYWEKSGKAMITSIAVLPFLNMSNDPEKEYLSDGISESVINRLSQLPGMKVIASSSSFKYKGQAADPLEVARSLNVTGVISGHVTQQGDSLLISVELIDGRDRTQVWGEQYARKATDLLAVQAEISRTIAEKLRLTTDLQRQVNQRENQKAYELLLKGRFYRFRGRSEDRNKAAEFFNQAITIDPGYALAYAELADTYRSLIESSLLDSKEFSPKARDAAKKAIELDEGLAEGHYAMANLQTNAWEWKEAEREYRRALELNPNLAQAHRWYASYLRIMGRHEQAIVEIERARELDPLSLAVNAAVGQTLYYARRYDEAIEALKRKPETDEDHPLRHLFLGLTYAAKGMYKEAIAAYDETIKLGLDVPGTQIWLGAAYAQSGDRERARAVLKNLQTGKSYVSPGLLAILYTALGEREEAFSSLEKAYESHDLWLHLLGTSPGYDSLRSDPRFQDLLRRIGLRP